MVFKTNNWSLYGAAASFQAFGALAGFDPPLDFLLGFFMACDNGTRSFSIVAGAASGASTDGSVGQKSTGSEDHGSASIGITIA